MEITPVAFFHCDKTSPVEAARQGSIDLASQSALGEIRFNEGSQFEQALEDIEGFSHLWILYHFHENRDWKPKVMPPRGSETKKGVFSTRSPYRPNGLGLSCVELVSKKGLSLFVRNFDLLHGSPIFDIKPYLAYSDSFPEAKMGWLQDIQSEQFAVRFSDLAQRQLQFLEDHGLNQVQNILQQQLSFDPLNNQKKRVKLLPSKPDSQKAVFAYKTWRFEFVVQAKALEIIQVLSGYSEEEFLSLDDPYQDKEIHRLFKNFIF